MASLKSTSETEQMYLMTIALLGESSQSFPIPVSHLAEALNVTPISANQMIHHLQEVDLVSYLPYKGVELTEAGWEMAHKIIRSRRLWETFLVEHLQYTPDEAETLACELEHAIPGETAERLSAFLGQPQVSPQGKPIPQVEVANSLASGIPLSALTAGAQGIVRAIKGSEAERSFLREAGLQVGAAVELIGVHNEVAVLITVKSSNQAPLNLSIKLAQKIVIATKV